MATQLRLKDPQAAFGRSLIPSAARLPVQGVELPKKRLEARKIIREHVPRVPGIYGYIDRSHRLIYVGKSKSLRNRLLSYQSKTPPDDKMARIVQQAKGLVWEPISHELLALIREQELISRWRPVCNVQGQPQRRQPVFVKLDMSQAPFAAHARRVQAGPHHFFGPVAGSAEVGKAIVSLNYAFRLRDCQAKTPINFGNQLELFPEVRTPLCIRAELGTCPAPCAGGCTREQYDDQAQDALAFLRGDDLSILARLQEEMFDAAQRQAYETATIRRNQLDQLDWLNRRLEMLRRARREQHGLFPLPGFDHQTVWVLLQAGMMIEMIATDDKASSWEQLQHRVNHVQLDETPRIPKSVHEIYMQMILVSWFRKHREDRFRIVDFDDSERLQRHHAAAAC